MDEKSQEDGWSVAQVVALAVLPFAIYVAFWLIDWTGNDSLLRYVLPVVFCVVAPSAAGSLAQAVVNAARR